MEDKDSIQSPESRIEEKAKSLLQMIRDKWDALEKTEKEFREGRIIVGVTSAEGSLSSNVITISVNDGHNLGERKMIELTKRDDGKIEIMLQAQQQKGDGNSKTILLPIMSSDGNIPKYVGIEDIVEIQKILTSLMQKAEDARQGRIEETVALMRGALEAFVIELEK